MASIWDITGLFGVTPDIADAVIKAELDPTSENVAEAFAAFARNGQTPPAKLVAHLIMINEERYPEDLYRGRVFPYLLAAVGLALFLITRKRR